MLGLEKINISADLQLVINKSNLVILILDDTAVAGQLGSKV